MSNSSRVPLGTETAPPIAWITYDEAGDPIVPHLTEIEADAYMLKELLMNETVMTKAPLYLADDLQRASVSSVDDAKEEVPTPYVYEVVGVGCNYAGRFISRVDAENSVEWQNKRVPRHSPFRVIPLYEHPPRVSLDQSNEGAPGRVWTCHVGDVHEGGRTEKVVATESLAMAWLEESRVASLKRVEQMDAIARSPGDEFEWEVTGISRDESSMYYHEMGDIYIATRVEVEGARVSLDDDTATQPVVDDPECDGTDFAHPAWWRGEKAGGDQVIRSLTEILDTREHVGVFGDAKLEVLAQRILALVSDDTARDAARQNVAFVRVPACRERDGIEGHCNHIVNTTATHREWRCCWCYDRTDEELSPRLHTAFALAPIPHGKYKPDEPIMYSAAAARLSGSANND